MSAQYLLPCVCGQKIRVEAAQAGSEVACACGVKHQVPTLRGLRQLEVAPPDKSQAGRASGRSWGPVRGAMFSSGVLVLVASILVLGYTYLQFTQASQLTEDRSSDINKWEGETIDAMSVMDAVAAFESLREEGLGVPVEPFWITAKKIAAQKRSLMIGALGAALAGIVAIAGSLMIPAPRVG